MTANLWQSYGILLPTASAGSSVVDMLTRDTTLGRVLIDLTVAATDPDTSAAWPAGSTWLVQRSTDLLHWATVRGGTSIPVSATQAPLSDYEYEADIQNTYRVQVVGPTGVLWTFTDAITPVLATDPNQVWLKDIFRPYVNAKFTAASATDITRSSRTTTYAIVGSRNPVAVSDFRAGRAYSLTVLCETPDDDLALDAVTDSGSVLYLQTPASFPLATGYYAVGDAVRSWQALNPAALPQRWYTLPLTEVAPPNADLTGGTSTWVAVANTYATWADVLAGPASWNDLIQQIADVGGTIIR